MRDALSGFTGVRMDFRAVFSTYAKTTQGRNVLLIRELYTTEGVYICDHLWMHRSKVLKELELKPGDKITFSAEIERYWKDKFIVTPADAEYDFGFKGVEVLTLHRAGEQYPKPIIKKENGHGKRNKYRQ